VSVVFSCCWASPAESFSGLSPAGLLTIFYCLNIVGWQTAVNNRSRVRCWDPLRATTSEDIEDVVSAVVRNRVHELV
jgi:hypothetical protein